MKKIYSLITLLMAFLWLGTGTVWGETLTTSGGSSGNYLPIYGTWADADQHNQFIISASELEQMQNGIVTGLTFYAKSNSVSWTGGSAPSATVKMANVTIDNLSSGLYDGELENVWSGTFSVVNGEWVLSFESGTSFTYGEGNLLIDITTATGGGYASSLSFDAAYVANAGRYSYNSTNSPNNYVPKTTFTYTPGAAPTCPKPSALTPGEITTTNATFTWTAGGSETAWQYLCLPATTALTDEAWAGAASVTEATATVNGLTANTSYKFYLRADCGSVDGQSKEISAAFTTACGTENLPFNKSFSSDANGDIPQCWLELHNGNYNKPTILSKALYFNGNNNKNNKDKKAIVILPEFEQDIQTLKISITYKNSGTGAAYPLFQIGYIPADSVNDITKFHSLKELDKYYTYSTPEYTTSTAFALTGAKSGSRIAIAYTNTTTTSTSSSMSNYAGYIQAILVESAIDCSQPQDVTISGITGEGAHVAWTALEGVTTYRYCVVTHGDAADWSKAQNVNTNAVDLTGLTAGTEYDFYVQGKCAGENWTEASAAVAFIPTSCPSVTSVTLNNPLYNGVTVNWTSNGSATYDVRYKVVDAESWTVCAEEVEGNSKAITGLVANTEYIIAVKPHCSEAWLAAENNYTPVYTLPGVPAISAITTSGANVSWDAAGGGATGYEYVLMEGAAAADWTSPTATETTSATLSELTDGKQYTFYVRAQFGEAKSEAVSQSFNTSTIAPVISNEYTATTSAITFSWTYEGSAEKFQVSQNGTDWSVAQAEKEATINELTSGTSYTLYVRAYYSESVQSAGVSKVFQTECAVATLPFAAEGFESGLPNCWSAASQWSVYSYSGSGHESSTAMRYNASATADLTLPEIALSDKAQLTFWRKSSYVSCSVYVNDGEGEKKLEDFAASSSWTLSTVDLSDYKGKTVTIIIRGNSYYSNYYLYIDDVAISYLPVAVPTNVVASPANASAVVTWESNEEGAKFNLQYRLTSEENWTEVDNISEKTYTIEPLTNGSAYEVQVKVVASANRQSDWSASANVTPVDCPTVQEITFGARTFSSIVVNWTANAEASSWTLRFKQGESGWSAPINCTERTHTLSDLAPNVPYYVEVKAGCGADDTYKVSSEFSLAYTTPDAGDATAISETEATFTWSEVADADGDKKYEYAVVAHGEAASNWIGLDETTVTVNTLDPGTAYDFYVRAKYSTGVSTADVVEFSTITIKPTELVATLITDESAKLTWNKTGIQPANFQYATAPDAEEWTNVAGTQLEVTLTGLTANTSYTYYLRSAYDNSVKSESASVTFKTACTAYVVDAENPFTEDFNGLTAAGTIPECWDNAEGTTTNANYKWSYYAYGHDGACVRFESDYNAKDATNVLATPTIQLDVEATLKFWCKNAKGGAFEVKISANGGERETLLSGLTSISSWTEKEVDLSDYTGKSVVLYFCGTSNYANGGLICLDDVNITAIPACGTPKNVQATNVLYNTATITWEKGGKETAWIVEYATNEDFTEGFASKNADATSVALTDLTTNTKYYVRVKGDCESATYSEVINFTPAYIAPSDVAVSEITTASAQVDWTANSGEAVWTVQYKKAADAEWTSIENVVAHPYTLEGLASATSYEVRVLAGGENSNKVSFTTECAVVAALGYTEGFEGMEVGNYSESKLLCWDELNAVHTSAYSYPQLYVNNSSDYVQTGSKSLYFVSSTNTLVYAILPAFSGSYEGLQITFSHKEESATASGITAFGYMTDVADAATFVELHTCGRQTSWQKEIVSIDAVPAGARLAFRHGGSGSNYYTGIDDISIKEIPSCAVPTELAASEVTAATATLSWTSEAAKFKVQYTTDKDNWGEEHEVEGTNYVINGLTEHTTYYAHVKAICGEASESEYCEEISFTTSWSAQSYPYAYSFGETLDARWSVVENHGSNTWTMASEDENYFAQYKTTSNGFNHSVLQTPEVTIPSESDPYLIFNWRNTGAGAEVKISVNGAAAVVLDADFNTELSTVTSTWALKKVSLAAYKGQTVRILFNAISGTANKSAELDEVRFDEKPCLVPTDLKASATEGGASITWTAAWDETSWNLQYKKTSEDAEHWQLIENVTENPYNLSGLTYNVEYEVQIQAICGENVSEWSASATFTPTKSTGMDELNGTESVGTKIMENGVLYIIRDGIKYNAQGARVSQN